METDKFWFSFGYAEIEALLICPNREIEQTLSMVDMDLREEF